MQMEKDRRKENGYYDHGSESYGVVHRGRMNNGSSSENGTSCGQILPDASSNGLNYIEHHVSKLDTLAGVAIKYGVEVADIKKMNGLVTDRQMFALKTLHIPLPGRHPPSPSLLNGSIADNEGQYSSDQASTCSMPSDLCESFPLKVKTPNKRISQAMSSLQGYYGLKPKDQQTKYEGFEMVFYRNGGSNPEDGPTNPPLSHNRKSKSFVNTFLDENGEFVDSTPIAEAGEGDLDNWSEKLVRRRQRSVTDFSCTPEVILKEDGSGSGGFYSIAGKGLALRSKAAGRIALVNDADVGGLNPIPIHVQVSSLSDGFSAVRKSSSTSNLQDSENGGASSLSIWSTSKWSLKPDLQATAAIATQIFEGLPKPNTGRRNKAALD